MRLWTLHPKYLDARGLVALWREALLARQVLRGKTRGYKHHPQLLRFRRHPRPVRAINTYLSFVYREALARGYDFRKDKLHALTSQKKIPATSGQVNFEAGHLLRKLKKRDISRWKSLRGMEKLQVHPSFVIRRGAIESWEKT